LRTAFKVAPALTLPILHQNFVYIQILKPPIFKLKRSSSKTRGTRGNWSRDLIKG